MNTEFPYSVEIKINVHAYINDKYDMICMHYLRWWRA